MIYCKRCVVPNTRPGLTLHDDGVCAACKWHERKHEIDWDGRKHELQSIADKAKQESNGPWHCVIGVSGGKDSTWQAMYARDVLGLNPLLVQYSSAEGSTLGRENLENLVQLGFSLVSYHPAEQIAQKLAKKSFYEFGNLCKYSESCLFPIPYRVAMSYGIPLVFFGENPALESGDSNLIESRAWDATTIRYNNTLGGAPLDIWLGDGIEEKHILPYVFPTDHEFELWGGKGVFMGYFVPWSGFRNAIYAIQNGLKCVPYGPKEIGNHHKHNALDWEAVAINSMLKHMKLGFGHTTEFSCYDIREGRISRDEGIALIQAYDGKCDPKFIEDHCRWIGIDSNAFWERANTFYGDMWHKEEEGWKLSDPLWNQVEKQEIDLNEVLYRLDAQRLATKLAPLPVEPAPGENFLQ